MTKMVTSIAALQLVEQGLVDLDEDLSGKMPEMAVIPILADGEMIPAETPITLRHLLTHTSGFGYTITDKALAAFKPAGWLFSDLPRRFESGTGFLYGSSTDWVGKLVEKISGKELETYFRENITAPLGMDHTWFNVPDSLQHLIVSFGRRGDTGTEPLAEIPDRIPKERTKVFSGGGGLFSSPADYTRLLSCMLQDGQYEGGLLLKKETVQEMYRNQIGDLSLDIAGNYFQPAVCCNFDGLIQPEDKWGLAFLIDMQPTDYGRPPGTVLWGGVLNTYFFIDHQNGIAAAIFTQHLPFNHPATTTLFDRFARLVYTEK